AHPTPAGAEQTRRAAAGEGLIERALRAGRPLSEQADAPDGPAGSSAPRAAAAVPLLHEGRLLGALELGSPDPARRFEPEDLEALEVLAGTASAALVALERAQLETVRQAGRELAHRLNNHLALPTGLLDLYPTQPQ